MHISSDVRKQTPCCTSCYDGFDISKSSVLDEPKSVLLLLKTD